MNSGSLYFHPSLPLITSMTNDPSISVSSHSLPWNQLPYNSLHIQAMLLLVSYRIEWLQILQTTPKGNNRPQCFKQEICCPLANGISHPPISQHTLQWPFKCSPKTTPSTHRTTSTLSRAHWSVFAPSWSGCHHLNCSPYLLASGGRLYATLLAC